MRTSCGAGGGSNTTSNSDTFALRILMMGRMKGVMVMLEVTVTPHQSVISLGIRVMNVVMLTTVTTVVDVMVGLNGGNTPFINGANRST